MMKLKKDKYRSEEIAPDEIFLDARNIPNFNKDMMEGRLEKPISKRSIYSLAIFFLILGIAYIGKIANLQIVQGQDYFAQSQNNLLDRKVIFADRGVIYDRNHVQLAWNEPPQPGQDFSQRQYTDLAGLSSLLGYVSYPKKDSSGFYYRDTMTGQAGIEQQYDKTLQGTNGYQLIEADALSKVKGDSTIIQPKNGNDLTLTIDSRLQTELYQLTEQIGSQVGFQGGGGVIMDIRNGDVLAMTSYPEYDSNVLTQGTDTQAINSFLNDSQKPFLNRAVAGLYSPGSIVKPFVALAALNENVITPEKKILSTGSISIPNPYFPGLKTVFNDWQPQGWVDMRRALAVSSDVYFYEVGGGFQDQPGLGIDRLKKYAESFGIAQKTGLDFPGELQGVIPDPAWKAKNFPGDPWRIGDTYHTAIGQYGFQVTPIEMVRAVAAISNNGTLLTPHLLFAGTTGSTEHVAIPAQDFQVVREGMRDAVLGNTASPLDISGLDIGAKTGTAQVGINNDHVNSWVMGFFPYENPKYAFALVMEKGPLHNSTNAAVIMSQFFQWMVKNLPEYTH